jgi:hypothetical protein
LNALLHDRYRTPEACAWSTLSGLGSWEEDSWKIRSIDSLISTAVDWKLEKNEKNSCFLTLTPSPSSFPKPQRTYTILFLSSLFKMEMAEPKHVTAPPESLELEEEKPKATETSSSIEDPDEPTPHLHAKTFLIVFAVCLIYFAQLVNVVGAGAVRISIVLSIQEMKPNLSLNTSVLKIFRLS